MTVYPKTRFSSSGKIKRPQHILFLTASLLCLISIPLACTFGPLSLPFPAVMKALAAMAIGSAQDAGAVAHTPEGLMQILDAETLRLVVWDLRLPRVLLALGAGAGLAVAGTVFQGILRNPLADPFTLGVSGGAAFGAALAISLGLSGAAAGFGLPAAAFAGAAMAMAAVLLLGRVGGGLRHETLILAGVVVSSLLAALIALIKALDEASVTGIVFWIMGSFQGRGWRELSLLLPGLAAGCSLALFLHRQLDMLMLGDRTARHLGLDASSLRLVLLLASGALTASCVAVSGIIGFIGLIVPHLCRMLLGAAHGSLLPASALCGALVLLWSDVAARTLLPGGVELPVGVVTALLGGPFFCWILGRKQGRSEASPVNSASPGRQQAPCALLPPTCAFPVHDSVGSSPALQCSGINFGYEKTRALLPPRKKARNRDTLSEVSFSLKRGEFAALLGPNGSGKSTLLHCLSGLLSPRQGYVAVTGENIAGLAEKKRALLLSHLPQRPETIPALSAFRLVLMGRYAHTSFLGDYGQEDRQLASAALSLTGVSHLADRTANTLSGGELQRVLLARALVQASPVLLLDEATAGLDPAFQTAVLDTLALMNRECGLTILAAMHDLNLAALYCERIILLKNGRIAADGPVAEIFTGSLLSDIYECDISVFPHPDSGAPQALLRPGKIS